MMVRRVFTTAAALTGVSAALLLHAPSGTVEGQSSIMPRCLHDEDATASNRARREAALSLARALNAAEGRAAEASRRYAPLDALRNLPPTPDGFILRLYTDGDGYVFSLKDDRDPCQFGIFSDQKGFLYSGSPSRALVAS